MAFTCFECIEKELLTSSVARRQARINAVDGKPVGEMPDWPGVQVFLPRAANGEQVWGLSVGSCESCREERPCVNC